MIKRKNYLGVLLAVLLVSCQCEKDEILEQSVMKTSLVSIQENDLNKSRLQLAFMLSQALSGDYKMQNRLIDECSKAFDGDMNVLCAALFEPQKQKDSGKSAVWNTPSIPVKTEGIKGKAASDWISAGVKIIKLIGKLLYRENHDDYITELYDYVAKDNVIRDNSLINDSNFNRSFGGLQWWITSQQD